jgi:hypothetical protein
MTKSKKFRVRKKKPALQVPRPHVSHQPWLGFTPHEAPRGQALPRCPSLRCQRTKQCISAHDNLYCQRTHFSPPEHKKQQRNTPLARAIEAVPKIANPRDFEARGDRIAALIRVRQRHADEMKTRWQAGEFDALYGKYTARGVIKTPPPKFYADAALSSATQTRVRALG